MSCRETVSPWGTDAGAMGILQAPPHPHPHTPLARTPLPSHLVNPAPFGPTSALSKSAREINHNSLSKNVRFMNDHIDLITSAWTLSACITLGDHSYIIK